MNEQQIRQKIAKLREEIAELEEQLPRRTSTRGDPIVKFHD